MIHILFFLPSLGNGGAERVLINLANNMNREKFDITVMTLFDIGENKSMLSKEIKYCSCFNNYYKGIATALKLFSPKMLHCLFIKERYDIEVAYLEGIATRVISGCQDNRTKKVAWVHTEFTDMKFASRIYRSASEVKSCYQKFDTIACVSAQVKRKFDELFKDSSSKSVVQYNTIDSEKIHSLAKESITDCVFSDEEFNIIAVGKVNKNKGFDRLARTLKRLCASGCCAHVFIVGAGEEQEKIVKYLKDNNLSNVFTFLGYKSNPYKYLNACDLFVCSSYREGFSTAATEALIVGTPVLTVNVSGMKELLGERNEYGIIVDNEDNALYEGVYQLIRNRDLLRFYQERAVQRSARFERKITVAETEELFRRLCV